MTDTAEVDPARTSIELQLQATLASVSAAAAIAEANPDALPQEAKKYLDAISRQMGVIAAASQFEQSQPESSNGHAGSVIALEDDEGGYFELDGEKYELYDDDELLIMRSLLDSGGLSISLADIAKLLGDTGHLSPGTLRRVEVCMLGMRKRGLVCEEPNDSGNWEYSLNQNIAADRANLTELVVVDSEVTLDHTGRSILLAIAQSNDPLTLMQVIDICAPDARIDSPETLEIQRTLDLYFAAEHVITRLTMGQTDAVYVMDSAAKRIVISKLT